MKTYNVIYNTTTSYDAVIKAKNKKEAEDKVKEVIGEPVEIESIYEIRTYERQTAKE